MSPRIHATDDATADRLRRYIDAAGYDLTGSAPMGDGSVVQVCHDHDEAGRLILVLTILNADATTRAQAWTEVPT